MSRQGRAHIPFVNRFGGPLIAAVIVGGSGLLCFVAENYLTVYLSQSPAPTFVLLVGTALALIVSRAQSRRWGVAAIVAAGFILGAYPVSWAIGHVTYAEFGLTTYGIMPIPGLDITVDSNGLLWFRDKTHLVTEDEIEPLLDDDVEVVVVALGWDSAAKLDAAVSDNLPLRIVALSTPEAFAEFRRLKSAGVSVVLLAHSTC